MFSKESPKQPHLFNVQTVDATFLTKLKEKEIQLLIKKLKICDEIIISSIKCFTAENMETFNKHKKKVHIYVPRMEKENYIAYYKIQHHITGNNSINMTNCFKFIQIQLQNWNKCKTIKNINSLDEYFKAATNSWNMYRKDTIEQYFRHSISATINTFTRDAANNFFCGQFADLQRLYSDYLKSLILHEMAKVNSSVNAQAEANQTREICKSKFQMALLTLHYEVDNYGSESANNDVQCNNIGIDVNSNSNLAVTGLTSPTIPINTNYTNHHQSNYRVQGYRDNPLKRKKN